MSRSAKTTSIDIDVRAAVGEDLTEFAAFQRLAFRKPFRFVDPAPMQTPAYYQWKYNTPVGAALVARAYKGRALVASAAAVPLQFRLCNRPIRVHQIVDLASSPEIRGEGVFRCCFKELLERLPDDEPLYCLPNGHSERALRRAGFEALDPLDLWVVPFPSLRQLPQPARVSPRHSAFCLDLSNPEMFAWRFEHRPDVDYTTVFAGSKGVFAARRIAFGPVAALILMGVNASSASNAAAVWERGLACERLLSAPIALWIGRGPPLGATGFVRIPRLALPRRFPVFVKRWPVPEADLQAADWDVL